MKILSLGIVKEITRFFAYIVSIIMVGLTIYSDHTAVLWMCPVIFSYMLLLFWWGEVYISSMPTPEERVGVGAFWLKSMYWRFFKLAIYFIVYFLNTTTIPDYVQDTTILYFLHKIFSFVCVAFISYSIFELHSFNIENIKFVQKLVTTNMLQMTNIESLLTTINNNLKESESENGTH